MNRAVHFFRHVSMAVFLPAVLAPGQDLPLPRHERDPVPTPLMQMPQSPPPFLRPTTSIKPPLPAAAVKPEPAEKTAQQILSREQGVLLGKADSLTQKMAAEQRVTAALKRIVVMQGPVARKLDSSQLPRDGGEGKPVTLVGIEAPNEVVRGLEGFFGVQLTPDNEKKLLDTVRRGMAGASKQERKVEVLGWWPKEGVMAVGVYPEG